MPSLLGAGEVDFESGERASMFCSKCGASGQNTAFCMSCGASTGGISNPPPPPAPVPSYDPGFSAPLLSAPTDLSYLNNQIVNPYLPVPTPPKKAGLKALWIIAPVVAVAVAGAVFLGLANQGLQPLSQSQAQFFVEDIEISGPAGSFEEASLEDPSEASDPDFESFFTDASDECQAMADIDRLARFGGTGSAGERQIPAALRGFNAWDGAKRTLILDTDNSYDYASFFYGVLSFAEELEAEAYIQKLTSFAANCESLDEFRSSGLSVFYRAEQSGPVSDYESSFRIRYTDAFAVTITDDPIIVTFLEEFSIVQFGPNVVFTHVTLSEDATQVLGVSAADLREQSDLVFEQAEEKMRSALNK